jgi:hypothetical protein
MVARTAPAVLALLADGVARPRSTIITALADQHPKDDVVRTLMRLAVTGQLVEAERKYSLALTPNQKGRADPEPARSLGYCTCLVAGLSSYLAEGAWRPERIFSKGRGPKAPKAGAGQAACCSSFGCRLCNRSTAFWAKEAATNTARLSCFRIVSHEAR